MKGKSKAQLQQENDGLRRVIAALAEAVEHNKKSGFEFVRKDAFRLAFPYAAGVATAWELPEIRDILAGATNGEEREVVS
jgi:hypothetical protein